jgi:nucleotide-binding universal stress UspA family protein
MTYSTLMVHIDLGTSNAALLHVTAQIAETFGAGVIGIAAYSPLLTVYSDGYDSGQLVEQDRTVMMEKIREGEAQFHAALDGRVNAREWRATSNCGAPAIAIAAAARAADLVIVTPKPQNPLFTPSRRVDIGDLVMQLGRPLLIVPAFISQLRLDHAVVGWKDTRETRRAVWDALPLLRRASQVSIIEIADADFVSVARSNIGDVAHWLHGHGVDAACEAVPMAGADEAALEIIVGQKRADILIAGAYGHSRMQEWIFGGMTRDLLWHPPCCALLSH